MKCKACNGTGYVTACIYESDEIGFVDKNYECAVCNGTGQIEQTNEDWFNGLATEEKAKTIKMVINICISCKEYGTIRTRGCLLRQSIAKGLLFLPCMDEDGIVAWLKQPHREVGK